MHFTFNYYCKICRVITERAMSPVKLVAVSIFSPIPHYEIQESHLANFQSYDNKSAIVNILTGVIKSCVRLYN